VPIRIRIGGQLRFWEIRIERPDASSGHLPQQEVILLAVQIVKIGESGTVRSISDILVSRGEISTSDRGRSCSPRDAA